MRGIRRRNRGPTRRMRIGVLLAVVGIVAFAQISASADLPLDDPVLDEPLDLEDLLNLDALLNGEIPASGDVGGVMDDVSKVLDGTSGGPTDLLGGKQKPAPTKQPTQPAPQTGSWSTDRIAPPSGLVGPATTVSSNGVPAPSYGAAVGEGFSRALRRAADLAGPVAAPMILGLFAVGLLFVAARGPGRLVKVEAERKAFREQRTFRL